ncbi:hypothetical protein EDC32_101264 [Laceyella sacchari]|nr:hypothetical protein EDC32_101264 [Laceyella sacchari]
MRWREIELGLENEGISLACEQSILFIECSTAGTFFFFCYVCLLKKDKKRLLKRFATSSYSLKERAHFNRITAVLL